MPNLINISQIRPDQLANAINTPIGVATGLLYVLITGQQTTTGSFDSRYVKNTGNEPISGIKSFVNRPTYAGTGLLASGEPLSLSQTGTLYPSGNPSGFTPVSVTGSSPIYSATFSGIGGAQVILSGNSMILISGGAGGGQGGAGSGVSLLVATGSTNSGGFTGNVLLSGAGGIVTFTGANRSIIISGSQNATAGVTSIAATGITNTGLFTGAVILSGAGNIVVSTGTPVNRLIVISGITGGLVDTSMTGVLASSGNLQATGSNLQNQLLALSGSITGGTLVVNTGLLTGVKNDISFYTPFSITGLALQESFVSNVMFVTGYAIGCSSSGVGGAHQVSGASGAILQYSMTGDFYQRTTGNSTGLIYNFGFNSGLLYKEGTISTFATNRNARIGLNIYSGLSGIQNITFAIFGIYSGV